MKTILNEMAKDIISYIDTEFTSRSSGDSDENFYRYFSRGKSRRRKSRSSSSSQPLTTQAAEKSVSSLSQNTNHQRRTFDGLTRHKFPPVFIFHIFLLLSVLLVSVTSSGVEGSSSYVCPTINEPLSPNKYFFAFRDVPRELEPSSCMSATAPAASFDRQPGRQRRVDVVDVDTDSKTIMLFLEDEFSWSSYPRVLMLHSLRPVNWRIELVNPPPPSSSSAGKTLTLVITKGSKVVSFNSKKTSMKMMEAHPTDTEAGVLDFKNKILGQFGILSGYVKVNGANRINVATTAVDDRTTSPDNCEPILDDNSAVLWAKAYSYSQQKVYGCRDESGSKLREIHVVQLERSKNAKVKEDSKENFVYLSISPESAVASKLNERRDLTLILKSGSRNSGDFEGITWFLESKSVSGMLTVIADKGDVVKNISLSQGQELKVEFKELPAKSEDLWRTSSDIFGQTPTSFVKTSDANVMTLVIADKPNPMRKLGKFLKIMNGFLSSFSQF